MEIVQDNFLCPFRSLIAVVTIHFYSQEKSSLDIFLDNSFCFLWKKHEGEEIAPFHYWVSHLTNLSAEGELVIFVTYSHYIRQSR